MPHLLLRVPIAVGAAHVLMYATGATPVLAAGTATPPRIASVQVRPGVVVLPASTRPSVTTDFKIRLQVKDSDGVDTVVAGLYAPGSKKGIAVRGTRTGGSASSGTWTATARLSGTATPGTWKVQAFATDREQVTSDAGQVYTEYEVRTPTRVSEFDVVEPVEPGQALKVAGKLQRWTGAGGWAPYPDRELTLEFRPSDGKKFTVVDTLTTRNDGSVADAKATAEAAGTWRIAFAGHDTRAATVSREDEVKPVEPKKPEPKDEPTVKPTAEPTADPSPTASARPTPGPTPRADAPARPAAPPRATRPPLPRRTPAPQPARPRQPAGTNAVGDVVERSGAVNR